MRFYTSGTNQTSSTPNKTLSLVAIYATVIAIALAGGLSLLVATVIVGITTATLFTNQSIGQILKRLPSSLGGWRTLFIMLSVVLGVSLLVHGQPADAQLFEGAKGAAESGIGTYIGSEESTSIIDVITFGMWALAAVGGIAVIAGGAAQNIQVLIGGLVLFFGMAVLIGVLEFTDGLLFGA